MKPFATASSPPYPKRVLRILHTADWHLGKSLRGFSRHAEHRTALGQIVQLAEQHQPNALLVAGDIFDSPNPLPESLTLYYQILRRLHKACPSMSIVITAGNHDAATRLEAPRDILEAIQVHVVGNIRRRDKHTLSDRHLIPIHSPDRHLLGHILAVSYPTASCLPAVSPDGSHTRIIRQTTTLYQTLLNQTRDTWAGLPLILTGHLHVHGATETASSERRILIGGENAFPAALFPEEANYVALGHLHKPQQAGAPHIRYSGSLFPLSAAEADYPHSVTLVEIDKQQLTTQQLPIFRPVPFHRLPHKGFAPFDTIESLLDRIQPDQAIPPDQYPFVQLRLSRPNLPTLFREKLDQYADRYRLRLVETRLEDAPGSPLTLAPTPTTTVSDLDPSYFFDLAFQRTFNAPPDPPHKEIFSQIYQQAVSR